MVVIFLSRRNAHQFTYANLFPNTFNNVNERFELTFKSENASGTSQTILTLFLLDYKSNSSTSVKCKPNCMKDISGADEGSVDTLV